MTSSKLSHIVRVLGNVAWAFGNVLCILAGLWAVLFIVTDYTGDGSENEAGFADTYRDGRSWMLVVAVLVLVVGVYCFTNILKQNRTR